MQLDVQCLPFNTSSAVELGDVTPVSLTTEGRAANPYPPGKVQINGEYWPDGGPVTGDAVLTWTHRHRLTLYSLGGVVQQDAGSQGAVEGVYRIEVLLDGAIQAARTQDVTGTTFTYTLAQYQADDPTETKLVQFRITPVHAPDEPANPAVVGRSMDMAWRILQTTTPVGRSIEMGWGIDPPAGVVGRSIEMRWKILQVTTPVGRSISMQWGIQAPGSVPWEYTINPFPCLSQPSGLYRVDLAAIRVSWQDRPTDYFARNFPVSDPGPGATAIYYVTIYDPNRVGDTYGLRPAYCETTATRSTSPGYVFCGTITVVHWTAPPPSFPQYYSVSPEPCLSQPAGELTVELDPTIVVAPGIATIAYGPRSFEIPDPGGFESAIAASKSVQQADQNRGDDADGNPVYVEIVTTAAHGLSTGDWIVSWLMPGDSAVFGGTVPSALTAAPVKVINSTTIRIGVDVFSLGFTLREPWKTNRYYEKGARIFAGNSIMECIQAGQVAGIEPLWNEVLGAQKIDNKAVWRCARVGTWSSPAVTLSGSYVYRGIVRKGNLVCVIGVNLGQLAAGETIVVASVSNSSFNGTFANAADTYNPNPDLSGKVLNYVQSGSDASSGGGTITANTARLRKLYFVTMFDNQFEGDATGAKQGYCEDNKSKVGWPGYVYMGAIWATHLGGPTLVTPGGRPESDLWVVNG